MGAAKETRIDHDEGLNNKILDIMKGVQLAPFTDFIETYSSIVCV